MKTIPILLILVLVVSTLPAFALDPVHYGDLKSTASVQYGGGWTNPGQNSQVQVDVCVYTPYDTYMDSQLSTIVLNQVRTHNVTAKIDSVVEQKVNQGSDCRHVITIERAINLNDRFVDHTIKYQVNGNNGIVYTYKNEQPKSGDGIPSTVMTNWFCMSQAHSNKYFDNYHITGNSYYYTLQSQCNPYASVNPSKVNELPLNVIQNSVDQVMIKWGLK